MASIPVIVKHQGKKYDVELDPVSTGEVFKFQLYSLTGVEPDRQKILVKGGQLKDETDLSKLGAKPGQTFMMMGTPAADGGVITRPKENIKFVEDMTEAEQAQQEGARPAGLQNLGNTCYLNSTLQILRSVPELQQELQKYTAEPPPAGSSLLRELGPVSNLDLAASLRDLYQQMSQTQEGFPPIVFLTALRNLFPQFAQKAKSGHGYAQQDAEEAWSQIVSQLRVKLKIKDEPASISPEDASFIDKYMAGKVDSIMECDEPEARDGGEASIESSDIFFKLPCHINATTNHLRDGILEGLKETFEKHSPVLDKDVLYTKRSKISRLPKYLNVHFVRFFWKREAQKKAKIMRKVTFPHELDMVEFCTDELKAMLAPVRDKVREIRKDIEDVERAKKRQKRLHDKEVADKAAGITDSASEVKPRKKDGKKDDKKAAAAGEDAEMADVTYKTDAEIDAERAASILAAKKELHALINPNLAMDEGANKSGLYELRGVVTHQGASADSGHYTSYIKKQGPLDPKTGKRGEEDGRWWWFNDDKVSEAEAEKIDTLSGGGESHSALILLYRAIPLPTVDGIDE